MTVDGLGAIYHGLISSVIEFLDPDDDSFLLKYNSILSKKTPDG